MCASGRHLQLQVSTVIAAIPRAAIAGCMNSGDKSATGTTTKRRSVAPVAQGPCQPEAIARKVQDLPRIDQPAALRRGGSAMGR